jgi:hypothetical protein
MIIIIVARATINHATPVGVMEALRPRRRVAAAQHEESIPFCLLLLSKHEYPRSSPPPLDSFR